MTAGFGGGQSGGTTPKIAAAAGGLILVVVMLAAGAAIGIASLLDPTTADMPSSAAVGQIPAAMLSLYRQAATACPGLPWTVVAAIGTVESDNDQSTLPGVHTGANFAGAEGPMQFEPATFAAYDLPVPPGGANPPTPYDPTDAAYATARDLCHNGGQHATTLNTAIYAYNHSTTYVTQVLTLAHCYTGTAAQTVAARTAGGVAVDWALAQIGTPYIWGGATPGVGFDCSGLVQAAYHAAGINLPRVAQDQYDDTTPLQPGDELLPGDLLFFGTSTTDITHVGIYISNNRMVDAPHTGADVRTEQAPTTVGNRWGTEVLIGITDPSAS